MYVLTYASRPEPGFRSFLRSCDEAGLTPLVLGYNAKWRGFGCRLRRVVTALKAWAEAAPGPVLYLDAFDVLVQGTAGEILNRYRAFDAPLVLNAETNCWPDPERAGNYPECGTPYRFLNAGGWIGEAQYVSRLLQEAGALQAPDELDDQRFLTELYLRDPSCLRLDTRCELFQCLYGARDHLERRDGVWRNRVTGSTPVIFHGNGNANLSFLQDPLRDE